MTSHLVAFAFFEGLRAKYPDLDLVSFLETLARAAIDAVMRNSCRSPSNIIAG